ncbi:hypothetical protein OAM09_05360, partial [Candidatus Pelagibacter sp.]|nr:hypothetical protein [Candidatus Pelagibacter sp.]
MYIGGKNYKFTYHNKKKFPLENYLYINGRIAFKKILDKIKKKNIKIIYCPNYICESIIKVIEKKHFKIKFYNVYDNLKSDIPNVKNSIILLINYFGIKTKFPSEILKDNIIIEDKTLSFVNEKKIKIINKKNYYFFASFRKIFNSFICGISNIKNSKDKTLDIKFEKILLKCIA